MKYLDPIRDSIWNRLMKRESTYEEKEAPNKSNSYFESTYIVIGMLLSLITSLRCSGGASNPIDEVFFDV